jgi:hypothetical protein
MAKGMKTGGRQKGTPNRSTIERQQAYAERAEILHDALPEAFQGDAHALLMAAYKDPALPMDLRVDAAKAAVRYEKPALSSVDMRAAVRRDVREMSEEELLAVIQTAGSEE